MNRYPKSQRQLDKQLAREVGNWWRDVIITTCLWIVLWLALVFSAVGLHAWQSHRVAKADSMPALRVQMHMPLVVIDCVSVTIVRPPEIPTLDCRK